MHNAFAPTESARLAFCVNHRISKDEWEKADVAWEELVAIALDHIAQVSHLETAAAFYGGWVQRLTGVHSVRWRVKDPAHLVAKIIRKRAQARQAYIDISAENYHTVITDLLGVRALHLFKDDVAVIHPQLTDPSFPRDREEPTANVREGDDNRLAQSLGIKVSVHPEGYRSVHYVKEATPGGRKLYFEVQVRTIFEEGWSEVDHRVRYPNYSDDVLIKFNSSVLNRLAGSADEMATAIRLLAEFVEDTSRERDIAVSRYEDAFSRMETLVEQAAGNKAAIAELSEKLSDLRRHQAALAATPLRSESWLTDFLNIKSHEVRFGAIERNALSAMSAQQLFGTAREPFFHSAPTQAPFASFLRNKSSDKFGNPPVANWTDEEDNEQ